MHLRFSPVLLALLGMPVLPVQAEEATLPLKMEKNFKKRPASEGTAFIYADHVEAKKDSQMEAYGNVEMRQGGQVVGADHLRYNQITRDVQAEGSVRFEEGGTLLRGPVLHLNMENFLGEMAQPHYEFSENHSHGDAELLHIGSKTKYSFDSATYTTCPIGNDDWLLRMSRLDIDKTTMVGQAWNTRVEFKGVPVLYMPWIDFGLTSAARSGLLGPTFGSTVQSGYELSVPYYWRIAPNLDATFTPRMMSKRGIQYNNEFRYLEPNYLGELHADVLPGDRVTGKTRSHQSWVHNQNLGNGFAFGLNLNRVSDDNYFRDLSTTVSGTNGTSQGVLPREGVLSYGFSSWLAQVRVRRFQTLQDPDPQKAVAEQYRQEPQILLNGQNSVGTGTLTVASEYDDFRHPTKVNAERTVVYPSFSYPLANELGYYIMPKVGVHYTQYKMGVNNTNSIPDTVRVLPIYSLDSGVVMQRNLDSFLGGNYVQTLEPRLYYVNIPYRNQDNLPNFDTSQAQFNFGQIFTENRFFGNDRIGDANMATAALTSRVIDDEGGTERLRVMLGERFSFDPPKVNLDTPQDNNSRSDILAGLGGRLSRAWTLDSLFQYNPNEKYTAAYNVSARYKPEPGKVLNLGYRFTRNTLRQADISSQWHLFGRWQGVGRLNYSLQDNRVLEALVGLEYNQACWAVRLMAQSFATSTLDRSTQIFVQLELNDLVPIGSDPINALRNSIVGYTKMNSEKELSNAYPH